MMSLFSKIWKFCFTPKGINENFFIFFKFIYVYIPTDKISFQKAFYISYIYILSIIRRSGFHREKILIFILWVMGKLVQCWSIIFITDMEWSEIKIVPVWVLKFPRH